MAKRKRIAAGNWKMNMNYEEGRALARKVVDGVVRSDVTVILGVPFIHLKAMENILGGVSNIHAAAQNCHQEEGGAYTGEISASHLTSVGTDYVILGHSERREYFGEDAALLAKKTDIVLKHDMKPIFCCGEKLEIREKGTHVELVSKQIEDALFHLSDEDFRKVVIAYEPIWAIGTGVTASAQQAQDMHKDIRDLIATKYGAETADLTSILYGGSVKPANAKELFAMPDVDGGLVGGASLKAGDFTKIVAAF
ncbi:MAG: triosephosphate isomerase [Saprospiraceae bacterium]|jgi:triosephosphate isomerase